MDATLLEAIRIKVNAFRIAEAKEVLQQLGLPRHGRKDELSARILSMFQDAATLTEQGHKLKDQARVDAAAGIVDAVFQRLLRSDYGPAVAASNRLAGGAAPEQGPAKRARLLHPTNPLLPQHRQFKPLPAAATGLGGVEDEEDVITAFMTGEEGIGALNTRVRCVCANGGRLEPMLQCEGAFCGVWQHAVCVKQQLLHSQLVPRVPGSDKWPKRRQFFCERCRVARADPFWEVYDTLVMIPQLGRPTGTKTSVQNQVNVLEEWEVSKAGPGRITLSSQQVKLLRDSPGEFQLQALALCLDDKIQFRVQWPTSPVLRFNNKMLRVSQRGNCSALGIMQRDAPANLTPLLPLASAQDQGGLMLDVSLEYAQSDKQKHTVLLLAYIMRRRGREQVKALMKPSEPLAVAVQRVRHFMHPRGPETSSTNPGAGAAAAAGGQQHAAGTATNDDIVITDDEEDVVVGNRVVSLKDPNTFLRVQHPVRFIDTGSNDDQTFELESFLDMAAQTYKWIDPHSMKASCVQNLQLDSYLAHIVSCLAHQPDVLEVEINEEAEWRPAGSNGPFRSVLLADGQTPAPVAGPAGSGGGSEQHTSDEEDEAAELRRAVSEIRRGKQHEVIEISDSDDEEAAQQPQQQQQQQRPASGLTINLPSRAQQQQQHLQQQVASASMTAAAAVGPHVGAHMAPGVGAGGHLQPGGGSGVMSPRAVAGNIPQQQQHQQQQQGFPGQQVWQQQQALPPQQLQYAVPLGGQGPYVLVQGGVLVPAGVNLQGTMQQLQMQQQVLQQQAQQAQQQAQQLQQQAQQLQLQGFQMAQGFQQQGGGVGLPPQQHQY